jgi:MFS family permease
MRDIFPVPRDTMGQHDDEIEMIELRQMAPSARESKQGPLGAWRPRYQPLTREQKQLDQSINRKFDLFVVFVLSVDFILQGVDKGNAAHAANNTCKANHPQRTKCITRTAFPKHAHLKKNDVTLATTIYSISYIILQPFSTTVARWIGCREWISVLLAVWGVICMGHAAIRSRYTFFTLRFLLGAAESGFTPTAYYFISTLYPKEYLGLRIGLFTGLFSFSNSLSGLLADAIMKLEPDGIHNWQVLYMLEGGVTLGMAFLSYFIVPGDIPSAWMLTAEEKLHAVHRQNIDAGLPENHIDTKAMTWRDATDALRDWRRMTLNVCTVFLILPLFSFFALNPLLVQSFGYSGSAATLMTVPPVLTQVL